MIPDTDLKKCVIKYYFHLLVTHKMIKINKDINV